MKLTVFTIVIFLGFILTISCKVEPKPIQYGKDHCYLCDMTVVDKTHAAQYVTKKGKAYMFDAIECMVMDINKNDYEDKMAFLLVADYGDPGKLINARNATYLICENIQSPMGANLSAFSSFKKADSIQKEYGGMLFGWKELKTELDK